jgi:hypothetical protein
MDPATRCAWLTTAWLLLVVGRFVAIYSFTTSLMAGDTSHPSHISIHCPLGRWERVAS